MEKQRGRILSDLQEFAENIKQVEGKADARIIDLAKRYASDAGYFLEKGDFFTAWGCINYAHGLLDALREERVRRKH